MNEDLTQHLDKRFDKIDIELTNIKEDLKEARSERLELKTRINDTYNAVDGFIKVVTKLEQEFTIMKKDVDRIKEVIKEKLGIDLS